MRYRKLDQNGDYSFGNNQLDFYINSPEAVAQAAVTTLRLFQREWYLDLNAGTPYFEGVLGKHSQDEADATLVSVITSVQGVVNIVNFSSSIDPITRRYSAVSGTINTIYGQTQLDLQNEQNL